MKSPFVNSAALFVSLLASSVMAAVTPQEADQLGTSLTPLGAQMAANADGSIPAWTGGQSTSTGPVDPRGFVSNAFAAEKPLFVITAQTAEQYRDKLSPGQLAMFKRYPETYRMPVYPSHRTMAHTQAVYDTTKTCATTVSAIDGGNGLQNYLDCRSYAFPIPKDGLQVVWNHITRYRGQNVRRQIIQAAPQSNGSFTVVKFEDEVAFPQNVDGLDAEKAGNVLLFFKQRVVTPSRLAGNVLLVHETIDQVREPRLAWIYNAGQRRVRRAPQVAYDGPGTASDGMRTTDNFDMFSGAPDRYDWKLVGKKEMYIPYNSVRLTQPDLKYDDILQAGHINQDLTRYELHRVWEVEATVKADERHIYAKRRFFVDEDSWQIALADHYDGRGALWRVAEGHHYFNYAHQLAGFATETLYDLVAGRYIVTGLFNEERQPLLFGFKASAADFTPAALRSSGVR